MSTPLTNEQSQPSRVNVVDLGDAKVGEEGWRKLDTASIYNMLDRVSIRAKQPDMRALQQHSEAQYLSKMIEEFQSDFDAYPTLFKKVAVGLTPQSKEEIARMLTTIELMKRSRQPRAVEWEYSQDFNQRNAGSLMNQISPEQLAQMKHDFINKQPSPQS